MNSASIFFGVLVVIGVASLSESVPISSSSAVRTRHIVNTEHAPSPMGPYFQAVTVGETIYVAGCLGVEPASGQMVSGGAAAEARQALLNLQAILAKAGVPLRNVVKMVVVVADLNDLAAINAVYTEFFTAEYMPPRSALQAVAIPKGARIELEAIAVTGTLVDKFD